MSIKVVFRWGGVPPFLRHQSLVDDDRTDPSLNGTSQTQEVKPRTGHNESILMDDSDMCKKVAYVLKRSSTLPSPITPSWQHSSQQ